MQMSSQFTNSAETVDSIFGPLDPSRAQIRVAIVQPRHHSDSKIHVNLKIINARGDLQYDALSWAWGDANDLKSIVLQGQSWWTPRNLVTALEHLTLSEKPRVIWIDALCINQSHTAAALAEREHQIGIMRHIYSSADNVLVWMGLERDYSAGVLSFLCEVFDRAECIDDEPPKLPRSFRVSHENCSKVLHLLAEPWWDRLWVLQEVGLAKAAVLYYGKASMQFARALFAINMLESRGHLWNSDGQFEAKVGPFNSNELYGFGFKSRYANRTVMAFTLRKQHFVNFIALLVACRFRSATDLHDKIYGLLGLAPELVLATLQPRYDEPVGKTYIRTAFTLMGKSQSLSLLSHTTSWLRGRTDVADLPSWVPDWSVQNTPVYWRNLPDHMSDDPKYIPSQLRNKVQVTLDDEKYLKLNGILIDSVTNTGHGYRGLWRFMDWSNHRRTLSRLYATEPDDILGDDLEFLRESRWDHFWQALTIAYIGALLDAISLKLFAFLRWIALLDRQIYHTILPSSDRSDMKRVACEQQDFAVMRSSKHMVPHLRDRPQESFPSSVFTTKDGFIGIGPAFMRPEDDVYIVAGARYPLVLRKIPESSSRYTYVGECYLAGLMQGEATSEVFGPWRRRRGRLIPEAERQPGDEIGIWEEIVLE